MPRTKLNGYESSGVYTKPTLNDLGDGSISIGAGSYILFDNPTFDGVASIYNIPATGPIALNDEEINYIVANYNNGTPIIQNIGSNLGFITDSNIVPIYTIFRTGTVLHDVDWGEEAKGMATKLMRRLRRTQRFLIDNGLSLSESGGRSVVVSSGSVWMGANMYDVLAFHSGIAGNILYTCYHSGGAWQRSTGLSYNNLQYDNGTNLVNVSDGNYVVNWIYRGVELKTHCYIVLGQGDYDLTQAQVSTEPPKPSIVSAHGLLIGRIIVKKGDSVATQIDKITYNSFAASNVQTHNDLIGLQGGKTDEYYHLTLAQYQALYTPVTFRAKCSVSQSLTTNTNTKLVFGSVDYDSATGWASATNRYVIGATGAGVYNVIAAVNWTSSSIKGKVMLYKNGVAYCDLCDSTGNALTSFNGTTDIKLVAGDYLEIWAVSTVNGAATQPIDTFFCLHRVG